MKKKSIKKKKNIYIYINISLILSCSFCTMASSSCCPLLLFSHLCLSYLLFSLTFSLSFLLSDFFPLLFYFLLSHFLYFFHFYVPLFLTWLPYSFFLLQSQRSWNYHHLILPLLLVLQFYFAAVLLLTYLILSLVFDHLYVLQFYFLVPIAGLLV